MTIVRSAIAVASGLISYAAVLLIGNYAVDGLARYQHIPADVSWRLAMLHLPAAALASLVASRLAPRAPAWHAASVLIYPALVAVGNVLPMPQRVAVAGCALAGFAIGVGLGRVAVQRYSAPAV